MASKKPHFAEPVPVAAVAPGGTQFVAVRETIESIVVAFALAFLIRTFEAEAFVIPTGSMSPSLLGQHKDVTCAECGYRFRASASSEDPEEARRRGSLVDISLQEVVAGMCPMCRYLMPLRPDLPPATLDALGIDPNDIPAWRTYPGDRILVNKFGFDFHDPKRWDVVVFKFPGDGNMNYIKRLTGLPGEQLRVYQGDLFTRPLEKAAAAFSIPPRSADKIVAMLQPVHDTDYEPATLYKAGWPLRWAATTPDGWHVDANTDEKDVVQRFSIDEKADSPMAWLRYRHQLPEPDDWRIVHELTTGRSWAEIAALNGPASKEEWTSTIRPELITDFNPYNARIERGRLHRDDSWHMAPDRLGANWVGDLALECDVDMAEARGELVLDLVEAGRHFQATFDLKSGDVTCGVVDGRTGMALDFEVKATAPLAVGEHQLRFANVDDTLWLWVDGEAVKLDGATYDPDTLFEGGRDKMIPWVGEQNDDQGDLAPAGVGARGAKVTVSRLAVLRDIYYIGVDDHRSPYEIAFDYDSPTRPTQAPGYGRIPGLAVPHDLFSDSSAWPRFLTRQPVEFDVDKGQYFVCGDNSPESKDARLWRAGDSLSGIPGGAYLNRRLMIGKAICVFWPHSWGAVPGIPVLPGWPNFRDMRFVR